MWPWAGSPGVRGLGQRARAYVVWEDLASSLPSHTPWPSALRGKGKTELCPGRWQLRDIPALVGHQHCQPRVGRGR